MHSFIFAHSLKIINYIKISDIKKDIQQQQQDIQQKYIKGNYGDKKRNVLST